MHACVLAVRGHSKVLLDRAVQVVRLIDLTSSENGAHVNDSEGEESGLV